MLDKVKSDPFDIAKQNLIEPYGLTEDNLFDLHNQLEVKGVDFADIYLQSIISESWNLEEGIVKGGAFSIDQGFGVRTVSGDRTSFAFSDTISQKTLEEAVKNTLSISRTSTEKKKSIYLDGKKNSPKFGQADSLYDYGNPVDAMSSQEKVELLQEIETLAKKKDPRISQVMASISGSFSIVMIVTDRGSNYRLEAPCATFCYSNSRGKKPKRIWGKWRRWSICYEQFLWFNIRNLRR